jgi:hypothetical protein
MMSKALLCSALTFSTFAISAPKINVFSFSEIKVTSTAEFVLSENESVTLSFVVNDWFLINKYLPIEVYNSYLPATNTCVIMVEVSLNTGSITPGTANISCEGLKYSGKFQSYIGDKSLNSLFECTTYSENRCISTVSPRGAKGTITVRETFDIIYRD